MADKKKLREFHTDLFRVGSAKGFKYFATHLRGREEMVCSVVNEPSIPILLSASNSPASSYVFRSNDNALPKEPGTVVMSQKQQRRLSGYGSINVGLPPASPSGSEDDMDEDCTMFLVAAYGRYNRPYVWVRSNHERVVRLSSDDRSEKDFPLLLQTTSHWQDTDVKVWDIIAELTQVCTCPCPPNPFAVDFDYFEALHLPERALAAGAMAHFLQRVVATGPHPYVRKVLSDLLRVSRCHFQAIHQLLQDGCIAPPPPEPAPTSPTHQPRPLSATSSPVKRPPIGQSPPSTSYPHPVVTPSPTTSLSHHPRSQPGEPVVMPPRPLTSGPMGNLQASAVQSGASMSSPHATPPSGSHMTPAPPTQSQQQQQQQGMFYSGRSSSYQY